MGSYAIGGEITAEPANPSSVAALEPRLMIASDSQGEKLHVSVIKTLT
jgi:hypothetical protein